MRFRILHIIFFLIPFLVCSQNDLPTYQIRGSVKGKESRDPISNVIIYITGGLSTSTDILGNFTIPAKLGDVIVFQSQEFETVNYIVKNDEFIEVLVEGYTSSTSKKLRVSSGLGKVHGSYIDSANFYKKKNIDKSIDFIERSLTILDNRLDHERTAISFMTLGDVYMHWKQYDLAISNYKSAIKSRSSVTIRIKLGNSYFLNEQYRKSREIFLKLKKEKELTTYQKILIFEGLGNAYDKLDDDENSIGNYKSALRLANKDLVTPKITDLNSKLASVYSKTNRLKQAQGYFKNSLNLAEKENPKRAIEEKSKVANFFNDANLFDTFCAKSDLVILPLNDAL